jgi:hypothetical protein
MGDYGGGYGGFENYEAQDFGGYAGGMDMRGGGFFADGGDSAKKSEKKVSFY